MQVIKGTYHKGKFMLEKPKHSDDILKITILIEEDSDKEIDLEEFNFSTTREFLKKLNINLSEEVIRDRNL